MGSDVFFCPKMQCVVFMVLIFSSVAFLDSKGLSSGPQVNMDNVNRVVSIKDLWQIYNRHDTVHISVPSLENKRVKA